MVDLIVSIVLTDDTDETPEKRLTKIFIMSEILIKEYWLQYLSLQSLKRAVPIILDRSNPKWELIPQ